MDFITLQEAVQLYPLVIFMIMAAVVAVEVRDLLSSVIAMGAVGLGLSVVFLILKAPDLAITQLVVEIMALILLIRATGNKALPHPMNKIHNYVKPVIALLFIAIFVYYFANSAMKALPPFGNPYMRVADVYLTEGMARTGAANLVASVILDFRGYDTLGEATVLFTAVIGVVVVLRKVGRVKK
jgi:multisubunit Na+/H+ antiporter MnhB subunit